MSEHIVIRLHPDDHALHAPGIALIQDRIRAGSGDTLEVVEHDVPGVITIERIDLAEQGHEHPERPQANERDGREDKPELQAEAQGTAPGPARAPMHDDPQEETKDERDEQQHGHASQRG